jgi:hypothetical protein
MNLNVTNENVFAMMGTNFENLAIGISMPISNSNIIEF